MPNRKYKLILLEKNGEYYRLIAAELKANTKEIIRVEEIVEGKEIKEMKEVLFELLPDWKSVRIERK